MSYRNPQIIVDRSAEIWAQGVSKIGETVSAGITDYYKAKKIAEEKQNKIDEANNRFLVNTELQYDKEISKAVSGVKDDRVKAELTKIFQDKSAAAMAASAELGINTNLSKEARRSYRKSITDFQSYMTNTKNQINNISTGAQEFNEATIDQIVSGHAPASGDEVSNLIGVVAISGRKTPGIESEVSVVANDNNSNILTVNSRIKVGSEVYNKFKESGQLDEYEESDGYVNVKFERDLSKWNGTFFQPIMSFSDRNKRFKEIGIVDKKDNLTKDFVFQNITTRTAGGFQYREQVVDEQSLRNDVAYIDLLKANAKGLMSQDIKQQKQFITGRLKWTSDTAKAYENATMEQREAFLIDQVLRKDLEAMGESREVTDEDVKNIPGLKKYIEKDGEKIPNRIYTKNIGNPIAVRPLKSIKADKSQQKFNDTVSFAVDTLNEVRSLAGETKKQGNKKFTMDEQGAFLTVLNQKRLSTDSKIQTTEDLKAEFLADRKEKKVSDKQALEEWESASPKTGLGYYRKGEIIPVDLSSPRAMSKTVLELLNPGIKAQELNKLLKLIDTGDKSVKTKTDEDFNEYLVKKNKK